ncbi:MULTISPECIES: holo-ACP synthase [Thalassospira]|uniref:Holo-[acyl-carrier-protein] synthase n=2 Tax=Thalassospira TaxID=168934 RepID=A0A367W4H2_9PROT|nr:MULTISPECIES: holo-ACP synthase [Thalassospira]MDG4719612.1 holo-ACP synthase [Thalassospira sp. FZY0004]RCK36346.1 4'-phosphopantetheinyl transferase [Thalassospira profundimaris]
MIIGIGTDLCDIRRIETALERHGERFMKRVFTDVEIARAVRKPHRTASSLAMAFAAKEACSKALGTGFRRGVYHNTMGVVHQPSGKPDMVLINGALARLEELTPDGKTASVYVTLTDEYPLANAVVVISAD